MTIEDGDAINSPELSTTEKLVKSACAGMTSFSGFSYAGMIFAKYIPRDGKLWEISSTDSCYLRMIEGVSVQALVGLFKTPGVALVMALTVTT
jgi:hypothetical protein